MSKLTLATPGIHGPIDGHCFGCCLVLIPVATTMRSLSALKDEIAAATAAVLGSVETSAKVHFAAVSKLSANIHATYCGGVEGCVCLNREQVIDAIIEGLPAQHRESARQAIAEGFPQGGGADGRR